MKKFVVLTLALLLTAALVYAQRGQDQINPQSALQNIAVAIDSVTCTGPQRRALERSFTLVATCVKFYEQNWKPDIGPPDSATAGTIQEQSSDSHEERE
jgi:hypothetical protein